MRPRPGFLCILIALCMQASAVRAGVISIRTGQVGGVPGSCAGLDDTFRAWAPQPLCGQPILTTAFQAANFDSACARGRAVVVTPDPFAWVQHLNCDPEARWIDSALFSTCSGLRRSVLYCAPFTNPFPCTVADSVRICWAVDDFLGDTPAFPGPNPGGVYLNGTDLGPAFSGPGATPEHTAVAYNVPINAGLNSLAVYQRDAGCGIAGLILSAKIYLCAPIPVQPYNWGAVKTIFR